MLWFKKKAAPVPTGKCSGCHEQQPVARQSGELRIKPHRRTEHDAFPCPGSGEPPMADKKSA